ncbi:MAG: acyl-CoA synthetase, partial [Actinobacteria bacterium]|nr:acyl-CoA synthetase [Actinomycetota bacterium]
ALISHPAVREAAVVGAPDRRYGEIVKAVVVLDDTQPAPTVEELQLHVRNLLAHFKTPAIVLFADELPRNASGKVLRRKLI